jgi:hypothetical protein
MNGLNYFLRRIDSDVLNKKFIAALNKCSERYNSIKENYPQSLTWFKNFVTATLIMSVERMTKLEDEVEANKIQDSLMDYYADEIEERWNELQEFGIRESITRILREERAPIKVLRRTNEIDREFKRLMSAVYRPNSICRYETGEMLVRVVTEAIWENLYYNTFYMVDDTSEEWERIVNFIYEYVRENYGEELIDYYNNNCNSDKMETNESELTERCWAGYTQKGMKTMFGKRYPNCVKKKKK